MAAFEAKIHDKELKGGSPGQNVTETLRSEEEVAAAEKLRLEGLERVRARRARG